MTKAEYFVKTIKAQKLTYGVFNYKYNKKNQSIKFEAGNFVTEQTVFDFKSNTVKNRHKELPIKEVLPFVVELGKNDVQVFINFKNRRVCILQSLQSIDHVQNAMNEIEKVILENSEVADSIPLSKEIEIPSIRLHKDEEDLPFFSAAKLLFNQEVVQNAKNRLLDKEFIQSFLNKESGDQTRRILTRYIPLTLGSFLILAGIGWGLSFLWVYLAYLFYFLAIFAVLFFAIRIIIPSLKGANDIYYGKDTKYVQRVGIILPFKDLFFLGAIPQKNNVFSTLLKDSLYEGEYDVKFVLSYSPTTDNSTIENEYNNVLQWIEEIEDLTYQHLRDKLNTANFEGRVQFIISSLTGYVPDSTGLDFYRSQIHPYRDNISVYHLEQLTPNRVILGYTNDDYIFIPYCKEFWQNISK